MKKAFTLIELLVVIAIIAILAAILFPVFAQAKVAAKKTAGLSNIKQVGTAIQIYVADYDDILPRQDTCSPELLNSALEGVVTYPAGGDGPGCTSSAGANGFLFRKNHFSWQDWLIAYTKNAEIFTMPTRQRKEPEWSQQSTLIDQFGINTGLTGALNVYTRAIRGQAPGNGSFRNSWLGGSMTAIPSPSEAMLLMEIGGHGSAHVTHGTVDPFVPTQITYPPAIREFWRYRLMEGTAADCVNGTQGLQPDNRKTTNGQVILGRTDSSAKSIAAAAFLAATPTLAETGTTISFNTSILCTFEGIGGNFGYASAPDSSIDYPMWGYGN